MVYLISAATSPINRWNYYLRTLITTLQSWHNQARTNRMRNILCITSYSNMVTISGITISHSVTTISHSDFTISHTVITISELIITINHCVITIWDNIILGLVITISDIHIIIT